jgi:hypothetical protein
MKKLAIHESIFESEMGTYIFAFVLASFGGLVFFIVFALSSATGVLCIFWGDCISIANFFKVRVIVINDETLEFISRFNTKIIKIKEVTEVKPFQAGKLRFVSYSNVVTVNRSFTGIGIAELIVMLKSSNPKVLVTGI